VHLVRRLTMSGQRATVDVVKVLEPLRDGPAGRLDVRILEVRPGDRRVDIRQFVIGDAFTGYTRRGLCLSGEELGALFAQRDAISAALEGRAPARRAGQRPATRRAADQAPAATT
jgi:hypothetical protein